MFDLENNSQKHVSILEVKAESVLPRSPPIASRYQEKKSYDSTANWGLKVLQKVNTISILIDINRIKCLHQIIF